jgi:HSP20 family protein
MRRNSGLGLSPELKGETVMAKALNKKGVPATRKKAVVPARKKKGIAKAVLARAVTPFEEVKQRMERMYDEFLPRRWLQPLHWEWPVWPELPQLRAPRVDVMERDSEVVVRAEMPGVDKNDVDLTVTEDAVTIKGATRRDEQEQKGDYYRREISAASFARTVPLPADVDGTQAKASFKDGVLEVVIPKHAEPKRHPIKVE